MPWLPSIRNDVRHRQLNIIYESAGPLVDTLDYEEPPATLTASAQHVNLIFNRDFLDKLLWVWSNRYNYIGATNTRPNLLSSSMSAWPGIYKQNFNYASGSSLYNNGTWYRAPSAYTSAANGTFSTDLAAGKWVAATAWAANTKYTTSTFVVYRSCIYRCTVAHTSSNDLLNDLKNWASVQGTILRNSQPLPYQSNTQYYATELVTDSTGGWWKLSFDLLTTTSVAADNAAGDPNNLPWIALPQIVSNAPTSRNEYSSFSRAQWSNVCIIAWLTGTSLQDVKSMASAVGLTAYAWNEAEVNRDSIFAFRALDLSSVGARGYAVSHDAVILPPVKLSDGFVDWVPKLVSPIGQIIRATEFSPPQYFQSLSDNHTSGSNNFAQELAANPTAWRTVLLGINLDHEVADKRPPTIAADTSSSGDQSLEWLVTKLSSYLKPYGFSFSFYTNDLDPLNIISAANGVSEASFDYLQKNTNHLISITDGDNYRGNSFTANIVAVFNRMKFVNGDQTQGVRPNFLPSKTGFALELLNTFGFRSFPITSVLVNVKSNSVTIVAPGHNFVGNSYVTIRGIPGIPYLNGTFKVAPGTIAKTSFTLATKLIGVNPSTLAITETTLNAALFVGTYSAGGMAMTGGNSFRDHVKAHDYLRANGCMYFDIWRGYATFDHRQFRPTRAAISNISNSNPAIVTTKTPHNLGTSSDTNRVYIEGVAGLLGNYLNTISFDVTYIDNYNFSIFSSPATTSSALISTTATLSFDSTALPPYSGGGFTTAARIRHTAQKLLKLISGYRFRQPHCRH